jgi:glycosyltransferase involved in cell wall biosynthesis
MSEVLRAATAPARADVYAAVSSALDADLPNPRTAFFINGRFLSQPVTGVQRYAREIVRALDATLRDGGRRATIVAPADARAALPLGAIDVRRTRLGGHLWEQAVLPLVASGTLVNLCNLAPLARTRQIVCVHDANVFTFPQSYSCAFRAYYRALLPRLAKRAARVVTVSHASASDLARWLDLPASSIVVAPNGHEHALRWDPLASKLAKSFAIKRPFILTIGSRAKHKNVGLILGMAKAIDALGLDIVVVGERSSIFGDTEPNGAASAATDLANVTFLGRVSDDDLASLLRSALCLAFPSLTEGFGLPLVEAMAIGCPVVASDRPSLREVCGTAGLLASPTDPEAWLDRFRSLATSEDRQEECRQRGFEQVKRFSWSDSANIYASLADGLR